jgi:transposase
VWGYQQIVVELETTTSSAICPACLTFSLKVHSHYRRTLADLPWANFKVRLLLQVRRFFCANPACPKHTFAENLGKIALAYARRTTRMLSQVRAIGFALGGEAGTRLAALLGFKLSPATLLRIIRKTPLAHHPTPRVLGIDDFALKRGHNYGTLLYDLETAQPIEFLANREAATLASWLKDHPGVEIISRDRASAYSEGAKLGAPTAIQVADRWHLLHNLAEHVKAEVNHFQADLQALSKQLALAQKPLELAISTPVQVLLGPFKTKQTDQGRIIIRARGRPVREQQRQQRLKWYEQVKTLQAQGLGINQIARELGIQRQTVRRFARASQFPERAIQPKRSSQLDPYRAYLLERWEQGCYNGKQLWRELVVQGYAGSMSAVYGYLKSHTDWFILPTQFNSDNRSGSKQPATTKTSSLSARQVSSWLISQPDKLSSKQQLSLETVLKQVPQLQQLYTLSQEFCQLVREGRELPKVGAQLDQWLEKVSGCGLVELVSFGFGVRQDLAAVKAGLELKWSNGPVEGEVNRVKVIKRSMYGRAHLDLLKARVIGPAKHLFQPLFT